MFNLVLGGEATCLRPMESNAGVEDRDYAAQKVPEAGFPCLLESPGFFL